MVDSEKRDELHIGGKYLYNAYNFGAFGKIRPGRRAGGGFYRRPILVTVRQNQKEKGEGKEIKE